MGDFIEVSFVKSAYLKTQIGYTSFVFGKQSLKV